MNTSLDIGTTEGNPQKKATIILALLVLGVSAIGIFFYDQVHTLEKNPNSLNERKTAILVDKVSKLIALPEGEIPTVATVTAVSLANKSIFCKSKDGRFNSCLYGRT